MAETTRIECEFIGVVNNVSVAITGRGHVGKTEDLGHRRFDLELLADVVPFGFDPAFMALGVLDTALLLTADRGGSEGDVASTLPSDQPLQVHVDWKLADENNREMGGFGIVATIATVPGGLALHGQFRDARTRMEPVERLVSVGGGCIGSTVPFGADGLVLTTSSSFETSFGSCYLCLAVSRVVGLGEGWGAAGGLLVRQMGQVAVERAGGREREHRVLVGVKYCGA